MSTKKNYFLVLNAVSYIAVLVVNFLAQNGMLGTLTTSEISDKYLNLFTPSGYVFMIWGLIYLLLGAYVVYQFISKDKTTILKIAPFVCISNILNILWLLSWHFSTPLISLVVILILLAFLILIVRELKQEGILAKTTFSIYYAWITVASVASLFAFLVSIDGVEFNSIWMIILTNVSLAIVGLLMVVRGKNENFGYILTLVWATLGIFINQIIRFDGEYLSIMIVSITVVMLGVVEFVYMLSKRKSS